MEYLNKSKICREFLNQYSDTLIPELLPKLMKVAIYALYKTFHKWNFSMQELDEFINFFNYKNRNLELESSYHNNCPCPPCREYLEPKANGIQKLNMGFRPPEEESNTETENGAIDCYGYGKFYPNDDVYINEKNNFYDENYYIPKTHSYRNIQLYHKRLNNPKFITQEKKIYPHWWWNLKDDIEQDDYSEEDSFVDHIPSKLGRFPKNLEDKLKKKAKRFVRNKSYNGTRPVITRVYDESKIFPNSNLNTNSNNFLDNSSYPRGNNSPSDDESRRPLGGTGYDGFGRPFPNTESNDPNKIGNNTINNPSSPLYATTSQLYRGPGYTLGADNRPGVGAIGLGSNTRLDKLGNSGNVGNGENIPNSQIGLGRSTLPGVGAVGVGNSLIGMDPKKSQIMTKRIINQNMQSTLLSFDKDFNVNGAYKKVKGEAKKGLKYSLSGNKLIEDKRGIRRRPKK
jgi:hypothetical protein